MPDFILKAKNKSKLINRIQRSAIHYKTLKVKLISKFYVTRDSDEAVKDCVLQKKIAENQITISTYSLIEIYCLSFRKSLFVEIEVICNLRNLKQEMYLTI